MEEFLEDHDATFFCNRIAMLEYNWIKHIGVKGDCTEKLWKTVLFLWLFLDET